LNQLPAGVAKPGYDRGGGAAIVHLGVGAFHRAHQAMYTDAVLASGDLAWGIVGAGIVSSGMKTPCSRKMACTPWR
jgi:fructuronate reductase